MAADIEKENRKKAVLLFVDEQQAGVRAASSLAKLLLRHWRAITLLAAIAAIAALAYGLIAPKWYRAQSLVAPVSQESSGSALGPLTNQLGNLASLAGLELDDSEDFKQETLARLTSREFIYDFLQERGLMPILFANRWNAEEQRWKSTDPSEQPTPETAYRYFLKNVFTASEDRRNGLIKITVDWKDPKLASAWANDIVARINADRRAVARAEAERTLEFLNRELARTNIVELRQAINRLIESEIRKSMLVNVREQYALKVIDPAFAPGPEGVVRPRLAMLVASGLIFGGLLGGAYSLAATRRRMVKRAE